MLHNMSRWLAIKYHDINREAAGPLLHFLDQLKVVPEPKDQAPHTEDGSWSLLGEKIIFLAAELVTTSRSGEISR